jgi:hypothetical protein
LAAKWVASHNSFGIVSSSPLFVLLKRFTLVCRVPFPFYSWVRKKKKKKREQIIKLQNATMPTTTQKEGNKIINIMQLFRQR